MAVAQSFSGRLVGQEYGDQIEQGGKFEALGTNLFGDQTSFFNGATEFVVNDVTIPGNSRLPFGVTRRYTIQDRKDRSPDGLFGDWELDLPYIEGTFATAGGNTLGGWKLRIAGDVESSDRCSFPDLNSLRPKATSRQVVGGSEIVTYEPEDFWQGYTLHLPAGGGGELLAVDRSQHQDYRPIADIYWGTKDQTYVSCSDDAQGAEFGQGFVVHGTDGTKYFLNHFVSRNAPALRSPVRPNTATLPRRQIFVYPTRIQDRFGNVVNFSWQSDRLTISSQTIIGVDTRTLTLHYVTGSQPPRVDRVTDGSRTWFYEYSTTPLLGRRTLTAVVTPDSSATPPGSSRWEINFSQLTNISLRYDVSKPPYSSDCTQPGNPAGDIKEAEFPGTMRHPSGALGEFVVKHHRHWRSNLPEYTSNPNVNSNCAAGPESSPGVNPMHDDIAFVPYSSEVFSLVRKTITGAAVAQQQWSVSYPDTRLHYLHPGPDSVRTHVSGPDGTYDEYVHGAQVGIDESKLLSHGRGTSASDILTRDNYFYATGEGPGSSRAFLPKIGKRPFRKGNDTLAALASHASEAPQQLSQRRTERQGVTFKWVASAFDKFASPIWTYRQGTYVKYDQTVYHHNRTLWVLGLPEVRSDGIEESRTVYNTMSLPESESSFGRVVARYGYHLDGTLNWAEDGAENRTTLSSYHRGVPQRVDHADGSFETADVDDLGRVVEHVSEMGPAFKTTYEYDSVGRLTKVTYPQGDTVVWAPTTIAYQRVTNSEYGIPGSSTEPHWRRTRSTGNAREVTYFDALRRPILEESFDNSDAAGTRSLVRKDFDSDGNVVFASYPVRSAGSYSEILLGTRTEFDALDRPRFVRVDSELSGGPLTTTFDYLPMFERRTTNPRGFEVVESFFTHDVPDMSLLAGRVEPLGVSMSINRDNWGKPTDITRRGTGQWGSQSQWKFFAYDEYQRLCKQVDWETEGTYFSYDAADNLEWAATGIGPTNAFSCDHGVVPPTAKVHHTYDPRNRRLTTRIAGAPASEDVVNTYFPDGALHTTATQGSVWTYGYNRRRLPETETLQVSLQSGLETHALGWGYSPTGHLASVAYPGTFTLSFDPDALGRARSVVGSDGVSYASSVTYHPNGTVSSFAYGNGIAHTFTLNARQLPRRSADLLGTQRIVDYTLDYDRNGNLLGVQDATDEGHETRTNITYDDRDRLLSSYLPTTKFGTGVDITETYSYDALDNVRSLTVNNYVQTHYLNALNQLDYIEDGSAPQLADYSYDTRGNVTGRVRRLAGSTDPISYVHTFDRLNRMLSTRRTHDGVEGIELTKYDGHGRRTVSDRQFTPGSPSYNVQLYSLSGQLMYEHDRREPVNGGHTQSSNGKKVQHIYLAGSRIARRMAPVLGTPDIVYAHTNPVGTTVVETDVDGKPLNLRQRLAPYGAPYIGLYYDRPGFTGHATDDWTELTYAQQRYYDPVAVRFLSVDPVGVDTSDGGNFNRYWYANNNPFAFIDPDGRAPCSPGCGAAHIGYSINGTNAYFANGVSSNLSSPRQARREEYLQKRSVTAAMQAAVNSSPEVVVNQTLVDYGAGLGDAILLGFGDDLRAAFGIDGGIDTSSTAYAVGGYSALAGGGLRVGYAVAAKGYSIAAPSGAAASAFRENLKNQFRMGHAKGWRPPNLSKYQTDDALRGGAGRTNPWVNAYSVGVISSGVVNPCPECN